MRIYMTPEEIKELEKIIEITNAGEIRKLIDYKRRVMDIHPIFILYLSKELTKALNKPMAEFFKNKFTEPLKSYVNLILEINKKK